MNTTAIALIGYVGWVLALVGTLGTVRVAATLGGKPANSFRPDGSDVSAFSGRLCRAHANCYESFPWVGGLLLLAITTQTTAITNGLALTMLATRIAQSAIHLYSTSVLAVQLRFAFFLVQIAIAVYWFIGLGSALLA